MTDRRDADPIINFDDERFARRMESLKATLQSLLAEGLITNDPLLDRLAESQGVPSQSTEELKRQILDENEEWKSQPLQTFLAIRELEKRNPRA